MSQDDKGEKQERRDFFISYTGQDKPWAEWIAGQLNEAGYTFFFQAWDFRPGSNFVVEMDQAAKQANRMLLVLSATYQQSGFARSEWAAAFRQDPTGSERRLLPVRIEPCELTGLLAQVGYIDLVGYDAEQARERLLKGIQTGRVGPEQIVFPGPRVASAAFPGAFPARWNIPFARNPFFTGREELLERLHTELGSTQAAVALSQPQAISGLGGIGKTQLAIEYAYRYRSDYQALLWVRAETTEALNASYSELSVLLGLPEKDAQEQEVVVQAVKQWLRQTNGWLLILDNADDLNQVQASVPTGVPGHLILTTRAQITGKVAKRLEVDTLEADVGALFLLRRAGLLAADASLDAASDADQAAARALTRELGGLPLALDQAGAYIEETECSLADYQQQYQTRRAELLARRGALVDDHPESVATTWSLSFAKVEQVNSIAAELLRACAFLAPDAIPEELLVEVLKTPFPSSGTPKQRRKRGGWFSRIISGSRDKQKLTSSAEAKEQIDEAVAILRAYSLISRNAQTQALTIHRLVQAVLCDSMSTETQRQWKQRAVLAVSAASPNVQDVEQWDACDQWVPHVLVCAVWIQKEQLDSEESASLLNQAGYYLDDRARYSEAEQLYLLALAIRERVLGLEHPEIASSLNNLALLYMNQEKYAEAEPRLKRALTICEPWLRTEYPDTTLTLMDQAVLYMKQRKYAEAKPLLKWALANRKQELGPMHPDTAQSLINLTALYKKQGKYAKAETRLKRVLAIFEQWLSSEHPDTTPSDIDKAVQALNDLAAKSLNNLALLYMDQEKYTEAKPLYLRALTICEQRLGAEHLDTALVLKNLGTLYVKQRKYTEAEPLLKRALAIYEQEQTQPLNTAQNLNNLSALYMKQRKYTEAEPLLKRALAIYEECLGSEHPDTQKVLKNYKRLLQKMESNGEAEDQEEES